MRSKAYIISASAISAQEPFSSMEDFAAFPSEGKFVPCKDPDFRQYINPMASRRMSSILKRSIAVSKHALAQCGIECPDAIITGTGNGCVSDTEAFLAKMVEEGESMLNPSKFICSTPNTIGSQIAIALGCRGFNSTHVNDRFAMEGALKDCLFVLGKKNVNNVLLCTADQMTDLLYGMLNVDGLWKGIPVSEGACAFVLSSCPEGAVAVVEDMVQARSNPEWELDRMLSSNGLTRDDIDLTVKPEDYKRYCGEILSASAFGLFCCCQILKNNGPKRIILEGESSGGRSYILLTRLCTN